MSDSVTDTNDSTKGSWWQRPAGGLKRSSSPLSGAITDLVAKRKLDAETMAEIEDVLIRADLGIDTAAPDRRGARRGPPRQGDLV